MKSKSNLSTSIVTNITANLIQLFIGFFIASMVINRIGSTAYGFVGMANDFISYLNLITVVFNSVAGRFISLEYNKGNKDKAAMYFNSVLIANILASFIIVLFSVIFIPSMHKFIEIPAEMLKDTQITFAITVATNILAVIGSVFSTATFVKNRLDLNAVQNTVSQLVRLFAVVIMFVLLPAKMYYIPISAFFANIALVFFNYRLGRKLLPEIKLSVKNFKWHYVRELAASGSWMVFTSLGNILIKGIDNLLANRLISALAMGYLSTSRTLPNAITNIVNVLGPLYSPNFVEHYANNNIDSIVKEAKKSIKINGLIIMVPIVGFIVFSKNFYLLWLTSLTPAEIAVITALSTITVIQAFFNSTTVSLAQLSLVTNKLKLPVFVTLGVGILNVITVFALNKTTSLGIYAIAGSSTFWLTARYLLFNPTYAAWTLGRKKTIFYKTMLRTYAAIPIIFAVCGVIAKAVNPKSWVSLVLCAGICTLVCYPLAAVIVLKKEELHHIVNMMKSKLHKNRY